MARRSVSATACTDEELDIAVATFDRGRKYLDVGAAFAAAQGCTDIQIFPSSIKGGDGNIEFFIGARRG